MRFSDLHPTTACQGGLLCPRKAALRSAGSIGFWCVACALNAVWAALAGCTLCALGDANGARRAFGNALDLDGQHVEVTVLNCPALSLSAMEQRSC